MKKIYLFHAIFLLLIRSASAQVFYQYFDGADTAFSTSVNVELDTSASNIWQIGRPQKIIFDSAATVPNAIVTDTVNYYPDNVNSSFKVRVLNNWFWGIFALQWKQKLDMDTASDGGIIEYSTDGGASWQSVFNSPYVYNFYGFLPANMDTLNSGEVAFSGTDSTWRNVWLCFDLSWMSTFPDTINFRFTMKSDSLNNNREGWLIDNMIAHITIIHTIKDQNKTDYLSLYPNPTNNIIHIEAEKMMDFHIIEHMDLINSKGEVIEHWDNLPTRFWFDAGKYGDGVYLLKIQTNIKTETLPFVVHKH